MKNKFKAFLASFIAVYTIVNQGLMVEATPQNNNWITNSMTIQEFTEEKGAGFQYAIADVDSSLRIRNGAGTQYEIIGQLLPDGLCYVESMDGEWAYITSGNVEGYVCAEYLITGLDGIYYVEKVGEAQVQLALQPEASQYVEMSKDAVTSQNADIINLQNSESVQTATFMSTDSLRQQVVDYALQFVGNPYVWGGTSLTEGADCSGFVQAVYQNFGISIPRVSRDQSVCAEPITVAEAQPGDLIFYAKEGEIYHVVMYIGNGQVVHASSPEAGIKVSNISESQAVWAISMESL